MPRTPLGTIVPAILLATFAALALTSAARKSSTWDETTYLGIGHYLLRHGRGDIPGAPVHPPLSHYMSGLPLFFLDVDATCYKLGLAHAIEQSIVRGRCLLAGAVPSGDAVLFWSRLPTVLLAVVLAWCVYRWSSRLFGFSGGMVSLAAFVFSPNVLAHSRLITPDLPLAAFGFLTCYAAWSYARSPSRAKAALCGACLGLALLSKHTGTLFAPIALACVSYSGRSSGGGSMIGDSGGLRVARDGTLAFATLAFVVCAGCAFQPQVWVEGLRTLDAKAGAGFPAFLNGRVSESGGWWYYYIVAFAMKTTIPFMCLILLGAASLVAARQREHLAWIAVPVLIFAAFVSCSTRVNIGIRYILPVFPFLAVLCGRVATCSRFRPVPKWTLVAILLGWHAWETVAIHPHYLATFNQFAGGPEGGRHRLLDSNLDWGQDLKGLKDYMDRNGIEHVWLSYFGTADPAQYGISYTPLPSFDLPRPPPREFSLPPGSVVAVSASNLYPLYVDLGPLGERLNSMEPIATIGYSILVYRIPAATDATPLPQQPVAERTTRRSSLQGYSRTLGFAVEGPAPSGPFRLLPRAARGPPSAGPAPPRDRRRERRTVASPRCPPCAS